MSDIENNSRPHSIRRNTPVLGGIIQAIDKIVELTSKLPLAGKPVTTNLMYGLAKDRDPYLREMSFLSSFGLFGTLIFLHSVQAYSGLDAIQHLAQTPSFLDTPLSMFRFGVDASFALVNTGVVITEGRLVSRIMPRFVRNSARVFSGFREWSAPTTELNKQLYADRILSSVKNGDISSLRPFFILKSPKERQTILDTAIRRTTELSELDTVENLAQKSESLSRGRAVGAWLCTGLIGPLSYQVQLGAGEVLWPIVATSLGVITFNLLK